MPEAAFIQDHRGRRERRTGLAWFACFAVTMLWGRLASAWIFPEHADAVAGGVAALDAQEHATLARMWRDAGAGQSHLCKTLGRAPADGRGNVTCLGLADLGGAAGDHSCTPHELYRQLTEKTWLLDVVRVANQTERKLRDAPNPSASVNAWSISNLHFERVDSAYSSRASGNNAHFVLTALPDETLDHYLAKSVRADAELNATGLYVTYHLTALRFAAEYAELAARSVGTSNEAVLDDLARRAIFSEAFALHFLTDAFSAGHVVGIWGGPALMKGTHDTYSLEGLPGRTWDGETYSVFGDASMRPEDLRRASQAVSLSLRELTRVVVDSSERELLEKSWRRENADYMFDFSACRAKTLGFTVPALTALRFARKVWSQTVRPSPGADYAHMPRFRAEIGPFFSFKAGGDAGANFGGYFSEGPVKPRAGGNALIGVGVGIGLEGAIGFTSDGLIELGLGGTFASRQYEPGCDECGIGVDDFVPARVPTRSGLLLQYRAPYWLIPGDLFLAAPLMLVDFDLYKSMAIVSANGGVLGLQTIILTPIGSFQFMLGRQINVTLFNDDDPILRYDGGDPDLSSSYTLFSNNSLRLDFPFFTYQPLRAFAQKLTSSLGFQLGGAVDFPRATDVNTGEKVDPGTSYSIYLRLLLTSRWYFGSAAL